MIAKVEPLTPARALRGPFDYRLTGELEQVEVGGMLIVPFGRRRLLGVVVGKTRQSEVEAERLLEPVAAVEGGVPPELVRLGLWVAEEYCSTAARGLALVLPPGTGTGSGRRLRPRRALVANLTDGGRAALAADERLGSRQRAVLEALSAGSQSAAALARASGGGHATLRRLEARGLVSLERAELRGRRPELPAVGGGGPFAGRRRGDAHARSARRPAARAAVGEEGVPAARLTDAQGTAVGAIVEALGRGAPAEPLLLHGVTGSGKTEVYLRGVDAALARGRSAIVLVPEIALTPQTAGRFERRFGERVAVLHSGMSARERYEEWTRMRRGEADVCIGPRSAVFAPLSKLGLVVVDEEHDSSYKQEGDPRYDARSVAAARARAAGAVLVLGSATPRPESWRSSRRLSLPERVDGRRLPPVELVSMAGGRAAGGLHPRTREALEAVRRAGGKAVVLLNRRGWSSFLTCRGCGRVFECPNCDVSLVLHAGPGGRLGCHHCGHGQAAPRSCPDCGAVSLARHGAGTERVERELSAALEPLPVFRLDSDAAASEGRAGIAGILARFDAAAAGVLVGTQMVAKGHDFPAVTLGVVLDADATLRFPHFRSEERTFALVAQLAGRSGRGERGGSVVVQALDPGARALRHAARHDADGFLAGELARREALRYPPFGHLIRVVCSSPEPGPEAPAAAAVRERIEAPDAEVLGPAPLFRRAGRERSQVLVKATRRAPAVAAVRRAVEATAADRGHRGTSFAVDVDPQ